MAATRPPSSESFLDPVEQLLFDAVEAADGDWEQAARALCAEHPDQADEIRRRVTRVLDLESTGPASAPSPSTGTAAAAFPTLGDYRLVRELGAGGMGVVYLAVDESLGREVALKLLPPQATLDPRFLTRFRREAQAAAQLAHPHIVPVHGVGESDDVHFFTMRYIDGCGLDHVLADARNRSDDDPGGDRHPTPAQHAAEVLAGVLRASPAESPQPAPDDESSSTSTSTSTTTRLRAVTADVTDKGEYARAVARIGLHVAEALAYAHAHGVLHRDIKPSNLLLDRGGRVWVTDFGLCKAEGSVDLTYTGDVVGTLRYIAPERFGGQDDARSDVYSLGITLYELLTIRPAFDHDSRAQLLRQILEREPPRPRRLDRTIPADLEAIVCKAISKDPRERYRSASELARDLACFLDGRTVAARPPSFWHYAKLAVRRNRPLAATIALACVGLVVATTLYVRDLTAARDEARWQSYLAHVGAAEAALQLGHSQTARDHLDAAPPEYHDWEWRHYWNRLDDSVLTFTAAKGTRFHGCAYSPDGRFLAVGNDQHRVLLLDAATGETVKTLAGHRHWIHGVAFAPDGATLVTGGVDRVAIVWDLERGEARGRLQHPHEVHRVAVDATGMRVATTCHDGVVRLWDLATLRLLAELEGHGAVVSDVAFDPDGTRLVSASEDGTAVVWDIATRERKLVLPHDGHVASAAFDRDGRRVATCSGRRVHVWSAETGDLVHTLAEHTRRVRCVAWTPSMLASCGGDGSIRLWDAETGALRRTLWGHGRALGSVAIAPGGARLASTSSLHLKQWEPETAPAVLRRRTGLGAAIGAAFDPSGTRLASAGHDRILRLWETSTGLVEASWAVRNTVRSVDFSPDGSFLIAAGAPPSAHVFDVATGAEVAVLAHGKGGWSNSACFIDAHRVVVTYGFANARVWDVRTSQPIVELGPSDRGTLRAAVHPGGHEAAIASIAGSIRIHDLASGKTRVTLADSPGAVSLAFDRTGRRVLAAYASGELRVWDADSGMLRQTVVAHAPESGLWIAFHPDHRRLATADNQGLVKIWSYPDLQEITVLRDVPGWTSSPVFSPKGGQLALVGSRVVIWDDRAPAQRNALLREARAARARAVPIVAAVLQADPDRAAAVATLQGDDALEPAVRDAAVQLVRSPLADRDRLVPYLWAELGAHRLASGAMGMANVNCDYLVRHDPTSGSLRVLLALARLRAGRTRQALAALERLADLPEPMGPVTELRGRLVRALALHRAERSAEARRELDAVEAEPDDAVAASLLAEAREALASKPESRR